MNTKQSGFGIVLIIVAIVIVVLLGYGGYRVYRAQTSTHNTSTATQMTNNTQTNAPQNTATYLDIKELGIKIKLSDSIKDATYYYDSSNSDYPQVRISTKTLEDQSAGTCNPQNSNALGMIMKTANKNQPQGGTWQPNNQNVFLLENAYIIYTAPSATCSNDSASEALETAQIQAVKAAITTVQLDH